MKAHYWLNKSYMTSNPPWKKAGDPPWGKVRVEKWEKVSKEEFEKAKKGNQTLDK